MHTNIKFSILILVHKQILFLSCRVIARELTLWNRILKRTLQMSNNARIVFALNRSGIESLSSQVVDQQFQRTTATRLVYRLIRRLWCDPDERASDLLRIESWQLDRTEERRASVRGSSCVATEQHRYVAGDRWCIGCTRCRPKTDPRALPTDARIKVTIDARRHIEAARIAARAAEHEVGQYRHDRRRLHNKQMTRDLELLDNRLHARPEHRSATSACQRILNVAACEERCKVLRANLTVVFAAKRRRKRLPQRLTIELHRVRWIGIVAHRITSTQENFFQMWFCFW